MFNQNEPVGLRTLFTSAKTAHTLWTNSWWFVSKPIPPLP